MKESLDCSTCGFPHVAGLISLVSVFIAKGCNVGRKDENESGNVKQECQREKLKIKTRGSKSRQTHPQCPVTFPTQKKRKASLSSSFEAKRIGLEDDDGHRKTNMTRMKRTEATMTKPPRGRSPIIVVVVVVVVFVTVLVLFLLFLFYCFVFCF